MKEKVKKLYFTNDFSPENVKKLQDEGWIIRNANLAKSDSFVEQADEYGGDVPNRYKVKEGNITVTLSAETSPELQKTIDDAKAECEKVAAENTDLKAKLQNAEVENDALSSKIKELEAKVKKLTSAEAKATKAVAEAEQPKE